MKLPFAEYVYGRSKVFSGKMRNSALDTSIVMPVCFPSGDVTYSVGYEVRVHRNFLGLIQT